MAKAYIRIETDQTAYYYPLNRPVVVVTPTNALATITVDINGNNIVTITDDVDFTDIENEIATIQAQIVVINTTITNLTDDITTLTDDITTINNQITNITNDITTIEAGISVLATATVSMSISGVLTGSQQFPIVFAQSGTLLSEGAQSLILTRPIANNSLTVETINSGTVNSQGTITINTSGSVSIPEFTQTIDVGDALVLTNQANADLVGGNWAFGFVFIKNT
jgi:hypothetical protein